jgi:glycyl-tRNA synthetase beta chain
MKKDFLLEIGCENLPSGYIDGALRQLEDIFSKEMDLLRVGYDSLHVTGTPNRLLVHLKGLPEMQDSSVTTITGPPLSVAMATDGSWTKAAEGFAGKQGVSVEDLKRLKTDKGEYLAVEVEEKGRPVEAILAELVPGWISSIRFPKVMKWDSTDLRFARPIRWVLALLGDEPLKFALGGLESSPETRLSPFSVEVRKIDGQGHYFEVLKKARIILDRIKREDKVRGDARKAAAGSGGQLVEDPELFSMIANLVESPVVMTGAFDERFLDLPREVIVTALKSHQRYFSVEAEDGRLMPNFIAFADGARKNKQEILKGYERVLQARLEDAGFYYREDTSITLEEMAGRLGGIVWLEGLGTLADKARRIASLAGWICRSWRPEDGELASRVERAAGLAKADLASEMVKDGKEFTKLQGYIGREYALASGEEKEIAEAIFEHYRPGFSGDSLPSTYTGAVLALADRLDTIAGCFIQGFEPTGSQDPYALRRQAVGVLRICSERKIPLDIPEALAYGLGQYSQEEGGVSERSIAGLLEGMIELFSQRLNTILRGEGLDYDLVAAILTAPWRYPSAAGGMVRRLQEMRAEGRLLDFTLAMKRIVNILPKEYRRPVTREEGNTALEEFSGGDGCCRSFDTALFTEQSENALFAAASQTAGALTGLDTPRLDHSIEILSGLVPPVNLYFDEVLVNCEDEAVKKNRISFLLALSRLSGRFCYFPGIISDQGN